MGYKNVLTLIDEARVTAEEKDVSATTGVHDDEVIRYLNQGKNIIYRKLLKQSQSLFSKKKVVNLEGGQKEVSMPIDIYAKNRIRDIKLIDNNVKKTLKYVTEKHDLFTSPGRPFKYYRQSNSIQLIPANSTGGRSLEITYIYGLPTLDKIGGSVGSVSIVDGQIISLALDTGVYLDLTKLSQFPQISICDRKGEVKAANIDVLNIDSNGVITVDPNFRLQSDEDIQVGYSVMAGPFTSTMSGLENDVEEYIVEYATLRMLQRQGSAEMASQAQLVLSLENSILDTYSNISDDTPSVLVQDYDSDGWW